MFIIRALPFLLYSVAQRGGDLGGGGGSDGDGGGAQHAQQHATKVGLCNDVITESMQTHSVLMTMMMAS